MFLREKNIIFKAQNDINYMEYLMSTKEAEKFIKYVIKSFTKNPARFMQQHRVEWEDLYQACMLGLFNGIKKIDLNLTPNEWVRYVYLSVQGEIRNFSRSNNSNSVAVSQRVRAMYPQYIVFYKNYRERHQQDPTINETMKALEISRDDAFDLIYGMQQVISMYQKVKKETELTIIHTLQDPYSNVEKVAVNNVLVDIYMNYLNSQQQVVIYMHYFLGLNKTEIAQIIGCGNSMVHKHIQNAFKKIRQIDTSKNIS